MKEYFIFLLLLLLSGMVIGLPKNKTTHRITTRTRAKPKLPSCLHGRVVSGVCKCYTGYRKINGVCTQKAKVSCKGGTVVDGSCKCPSKTKYMKGGCKKIK